MSYLVNGQAFKLDDRGRILEAGRRLEFALKSFVGSDSWHGPMSQQLSLLARDLMTDRQGVEDIGVIRDRLEAKLRRQ